MQLRMVLVTAAAVPALATQFVMHNSGLLPEINLQDIIKPRPVSLAGVASVIDGDTIEILGQRVGFNGIDAPAGRQYCDDAKGFEFPSVTRMGAMLSEEVLSVKYPFHTNGGPDSMAAMRLKSVVEKTLAAARKRTSE